jgi:hypothetical protein
MCVPEQSRNFAPLLSYLFENTAASDTLEGIVEWWLLNQRIIYGTAEVKEILDQFVAQQLIVATQSSDKRVHYRVNRDRVKEIRALLQSKRLLNQTDK